MNQTANYEIRQALKNNGIYQWELAEALGLRREVPPEYKRTMLENISFLAKMKNEGGN